MAFEDFGKSIGPLGPPRTQNPFTSPSPPPPRQNPFTAFSPPPPQQNPFAASSPPPPQQNPNPLVNKSPAAMVQQPLRQSPQQTPSPSKRPDASLEGQGNQLNHPAARNGIAYSTSHQWIPPVAAVTAHDVETKPINFHVLQRTMTPHLVSRDGFLNNSHSTDGSTGRPDVSPGRLVVQRSSPAKIANSPPHQRFQPVNYSDLYDTGTHSPRKPASFSAAKRARSPPSLSSNGSMGASSVQLDSERLAGQRSSTANIANSPPRQRFQPVNYSDIYDTGTRSLPKPASFSAAKRARSPPLSSNGPLGMSSVQLDSESQRRSPVNISNSLSHQRFQPVDYSDIYDAGTHSSPGPANVNVAKRARSPPLLSSNGLLGTSSLQLDSEREMKAKAKRLARFNVELSQPLDSLQDIMRHKALGARGSQVPTERQITDNPADEAQDFMSGGTLFDSEGLESSIAVVGLCPDMCPVLEREERERKGDLDKYERLDGDRNQTSKFLAVKKYNRTAERNAVLIRPMPVLQKTVDYLLQLLDRSYNDNFLGIYNFLWDRMRAIRMDLRMQHIFNHKAILMLEQMIRLHIIAMHELCEYNKGEGFSEGFDAHLNIEQMNKTSVELFQMYDNHRKKGYNVETEKEFRGYYALLKLDRHPGYKVEPSELSQDLAKMTPEIRCSQELLFARDVARACRTGNYIAFFRLARKASFLQACLMHAHFAKVRKQALASLHSGLPNNQGIPISHIVKWLAMEGEDIDSLLEHYGFGLKKFEEKYMVKEGTFMNIETDFPTKCSQLVHCKKSRRIIDDVYTRQPLSELTRENEIATDTIGQRTDISNREGWAKLADEEMLDSKVDTVHSALTSTQQLIEEPLISIPIKEHEVEIREGSIFGPIHASLVNSINNLEQQVDDRQVSELDEDIFMDENAMPIMEENITQAGVPGHSNPNHRIENIDPVAIVGRSLGNEALSLEPNQDEVANEKLKLILRKWKQWASMQREIQEQREFLANAALSSLSLGPPICQNKAHSRCVTGELNIDYVAIERRGRHEKSWSKLNVSELVAPVLSARNPNSRCISWKLVIFVQPNGTGSQINELASRWLLAKLRGKETDDELAVFSNELSIWKKWINLHINGPQTCCLSVIREEMITDNQTVSEDIVAGTSCIMFLTSATIPWEIQRVRLHNLFMSIPFGSGLPLLIVSTDTCKEVSDPSDTIINRLGLHDADRTRISTFSVLFLSHELPLGQSNGFFNDDQLREGLHWLANNSPQQPAVHMMKTRELALSYLGCSLCILNNLNISEVGPCDCISAFNEALDMLVQEIMNAASINSNYWPCPEINLLDKSSNERMLAERSLPSVGWSSSARIESLVRAIKECQLPSFPSNLPWMNHGCYTQSQIHYQKLAIEECLTSYLTQSSRLLNPDLAAREVSVMLQKGAVLELRDFSYHIVPRWLVIFQRIYNWQLMKLTVGEISVAYVLEQLDELFISNLAYRTETLAPLKLDMPIKDLDNFNSEMHQPMHSAQTELSLDEMIEVCCSVPLPLQHLPSISRPVNSAQEIVHEAGHGSDIHNGCKGGDTDPNYISAFADDASPSVDANNGRLVGPVPDKRSDRLSMLLKQCNQLQDMIDEKLKIYF